MEAARVIGAPAKEVKAFLEELWNARVLTRDGEVAPAPVEGERSVDLPLSGPRHPDQPGGELMPGGDNLEVEFEMQDWAVKNGYLWSAAWEMTYRCNESCIHCFNPGASHSAGQRPRRRTKELSTEEGIRLLRDLKSIGVFRLLLTGGEVLLRKDFFDTLKTARELGFSVTVFTNGVLPTQQQVEQLAGLYPHRVELSLYSHDAGIHDAITRVGGSHARTMDTARQLLSLGTTVALKMVVMTPNVSDTEAFRALCAEIGCEALIDYNLSAGVDGAQEPVKNLAIAAADLIRAALEPESPLYVGTVGRPWRRDGKPTGSICGAGRTTIGVSPEGHVSPCISMPTYAGSARDDGVVAIWRNSTIGSRSSGACQGDNALTDAQTITWEQSRFCGTHDRCGWCQRCPGLPLLERGDERLPSTVLCRNAAARRIAFDLLVEQGAGATVDDRCLETARARYRDEVELWAIESVIEKRLGRLDDLRTVLRDRVRASALQAMPRSGAASG
jgi:MoaA/NifB/PqqE/SkfB family radical SAM enzyme